MEREKLSFADCLADAQQLGYAEADPSFDVEGHDTAQKLAILASLAFGIKVDESAVFVEGISSIAPEDLEAADELGYRVKLLGVAVRTEKGIEQRVHPTMVPKDSAIAQVMGVTNAVSIDAEGFAPITLVGPGAGGHATASAVVADIGDIARGVRAAPFGRPIAKLTASRQAPMQRHEGGYYIRLAARRPPGNFCGDRASPRRREDLARIDHAAPSRRAAARRRRPEEPRCAGARHPDHLCDQRGRGAARLEGDPKTGCHRRTTRRSSGSRRIEITASLVPAGLFTGRSATRCRQAMVRPRRGGPRPCWTASCRSRSCG